MRNRSRDRYICDLLCLYFTLRVMRLTLTSCGRSGRFAYWRDGHVTVQMGLLRGIGCQEYRILIPIVFIELIRMFRLIIYEMGFWGYQAFYSSIFERGRSYDSGLWERGMSVERDGCVVWIATDWVNPIEYLRFPKIWTVHRIWSENTNRNITSMSDIPILHIKSWNQC